MFLLKIIFYFHAERSCFGYLTGKSFCFADLNPLYYYPSDPVLISYNMMNAELFFPPHIRAYSGCKAQRLLGLILVLLCASWSGALGFPALLHALLMLSGAGTQHWVSLCFPLQILMSLPYIACTYFDFLLHCFCLCQLKYISPQLANKITVKLNTFP